MDDNLMPVLKAYYIKLKIIRLLSKHLAQKEDIEEIKQLLDELVPLLKPIEYVEQKNKAMEEL